MVFVPTKRTLSIHAHWQRASIFVQAFCGRLRVARENSVKMTRAFSLLRIVFETKSTVQTFLKQWHYGKHGFSVSGGQGRKFENCFCYPKPICWTLSVWWRAF